MQQSTESTLQRPLEFVQDETVRNGQEKEVGRSWLRLLALIHEEHPDCTMFGVNVLNGNVVSCKRIQRNMTFKPAAGAAEYHFDCSWQGLKALCRKMGTGRIDELEFQDGRPVSVRVGAGRRKAF